MLPECLGQLPAQALVLLGQGPVPLDRGLQACEQGSVRGALPAGDGRGRCLPGGIAKAFDLGADVGFGVEPGPGHCGGARDGVEGDRCPAVVEFA